MVYILHFAQKYRHAQHYIGFHKDSKKTQTRLQEHVSGKGSPLVLAAAKAGIEVSIAHTRKGDRCTERHLKNQKNAKRYCPICTPSKIN